MAETRTFKLTSSDGSYALISNLGCRMSHLVVPDRQGELRDIVLGLDEISQYSSPEYLSQYPYFGAAIGRWANRVRGARFTMAEKEYPLDKNHGAHHLHGGFSGFDKKVWHVDDFYTEENSSQLELSCSSKHLEGGFPGHLKVQMIIILSNGKLTYEWKATTDRPTPISLTWHNYFNLDKDHSSIDNQRVRFVASDLLEQDGTKCPTGKTVPIATQPLEISHWCPLSALQQADFTLINRSKDQWLSPSAEVLSTDGLMHMRVMTNQPCIHFYAGAGIPVLQGKGGVRYGPHLGYCFESQALPDAMNQPHFPDCILMPGEVYHHTGSYTFNPEA